MEKCRFHHDAEGKRVCNECGARVCEECCTTESEKDPDSGKIRYHRICPLCKVEREIVELGKPLTRLFIIALLILALPLSAVIAMSLGEVAVDDFFGDASSQVQLAVMAMVYVVFIGLPVLGLWYEYRKLRAFPERMAELERVRERLRSIAEET